MTDEYKERIIKWLTGNYEIEPSTTDPLFQELNKTTTTINDYIEAALGFIKGKDGKGNDLDIGFIYGVDSNGNGVILVVDDDFNIIQVITEYDSGTQFGRFVCLNIDKTNGNIYGLDKNGSQYRFILLNNFLIKTPAQKNYTVKLRQSYFLKFTNNDFIPNYIEKRPSDSFYVMTGTSTVPMIATYKVEVGSTNELIEYAWSGTYTGVIYLRAYNIIWSGEEINEKMGYINVISHGPDWQEIRYLEFEFDGTSITKTEDIYIDEVASSINKVSSFSGLEITNTETFIYYNLHDESVSKLMKIDYEKQTTIFYYEIEGNDTLDYTWTGLRTIKIDNIVYFYGYENTTDPPDNTQAEIKLYFGVLSNISGQPVIYSKDFDAGKLYSIVVYHSLDIFYVSKLYNLSTYHLMGSRSSILASVKQVFNPLNDNFSDWQSELAMIPYSAWLYNNNKIIYARNLYNKVVSGNTTTSTVEVPNLLLNNIDIEQQDLLGQTNGVLVSNIETIQKNIYEDLYINFYNTLTMQNQNTQDYITNIVGASRLNGSISSWSQENTYNLVKLTKIRINYSDNTSLVKAINPATRISQFVYQYSFNIYVPGTKDITNIEMISQDEETTYQTITGLSLERSKSYKITQNVEIGE